MAELTNQDRLQPSLLDRLSDDEPGAAVESRDKRVLSLARLRDSVLRDLGWLLNTGSLAQVHDLDEYPHVKRSVLNYGVRDLAGSTLSGVNPLDVERAIRQAVLDFEPRILPGSLRISVHVEEGKMSTRALLFDIEGMLWAQPLPLQLFLKTEIDLETGQVAVFDVVG